MEIDSFCPVGIGGTCQLDTTNLKIFVGNLPLEYRSRDLFSIFITYGIIREAVVIPDRFRIRSRCYGFVTFVNEESVEKVFNSMPIESENRRLTIILACKNAKPRRAHFNVRHGTSGHRPLPAFDKERSADKNNKKDSPNNNINNDNENNEIRNTNTNSTHANYNAPKIYTDPSLFRTANIQPITPACIQIDDNLKKSTKKEVKQEFPNKDIEKDFERSLRIKKENRENNNFQLNGVQIKKDNRKMDNQSKDAMTPTSNTGSNHSVSCRWQFTRDNFDCQNDSEKKYKNEHNYYHNVVAANNVSFISDNSCNKSIKTSNENATWNRNVNNNRHVSKENHNTSNTATANNLYSKTTNSIYDPTNQQNISSTSYSQQNISKTSSLENSYSEYFQTLLSSSKTLNCSDSVRNNNTIASDGIATVTNTNNFISHSMMTELTPIKAIPSNPMVSYSGINPLADSVSTMLSYR